MTSESIIKNQFGKTPKRRNHTVPKGYLKRWLVNHNGKLGHWVLHCKSGDITFEEGKDATFAIKDYLYVPIRKYEGKEPYRDESVEDWFSYGENYLASLPENLSTQLNSIKDIPILGLIESVILLGFRSAHEYGILNNIIQTSNPSLSAEDVAKEVIDYFKIIYKIKLKQFANWDWVIFSTEKEDLMACDRPLYDMTVSIDDPIDLLAIPLSPRLILLAYPPEDIHRNYHTFEYGNQATEKTIRMYNQFTVERAREFIVGNSLEQLNTIKCNFTPELYWERVSKDKIILQHFKSQKINHDP